MEENNSQPENSIKPNIVETYADQMAQVISGDQSGLIKKIISEEEERELEKEAYSPEAKQNKIFAVLGVVLILTSIALVAYLFWKKENPTLSVNAPFQPMIFSDETKFISIDEVKKERIGATVKLEGEAIDVKDRGIAGIYLTKLEKLVGLREFLKTLEAKFVAPEPHLVDDNFMIGVWNGGERDIFILLRMREFVDIFKNLRDWEGKMFTDLHSFFDTEISAETGYLLTAPFVDGFVENRNARILYKSDGSIALMYVYVDDNHVVITESLDAAKEVMLRLTGTEIAK